MARTLIDLRAEAAMRDEDLRIATKHCAEAAARLGTDDGVRAYRRALAWETTCRERSRDAHGALIRANIGSAS